VPVIPPREPPDDPGALVGSSELIALAELAERLARGAGELVRGGQGAIDTQPEFDDKSSTTDLVTEFDRRAERFIVAELEAVRPDDGLIAEEGSARPSRSGITWLIDPIDGTTNFVYGQAAWSTSIAAVSGDLAVAAAVYAPISGELFSATLGGGAHLNGRTLGCTDRRRPLADSVIATGFTYRRSLRAEQAAMVARILPQVGDIRRLGSAAIDLCLVASGRVDAYVEQYLNPWDVAAGLLIASEAGAVATDFVGGPARPDQLVVARPELHDQLLVLLRQPGMYTQAG
jgi:myo-inositol-1(or 4)-monophosphatase